MTSQSEYASLNRWVLSLDLNVAMESDCLMCVGGREFHSLGAEQQKAQATMALKRDVGMVSCPAEVEQRVREGLYSWKRLQR